MFVILIVVGAMILFNQNGNGRPGQDQAGQPDTEQSKDGDWQTKRRSEQAAGRERSDSGDWGMEDVATDNKPSSESILDANRKPDKVQQGDWGLEEVNTSNKKDDGSTLNLSGKASERQPKSDAKQSGDWGMEEVDSTPKKTDKKTQRGDWGLEEVGSGKSGG